MGVILGHIGAAAGIGFRQALTHRIDPLSVTRLDRGGNRVVAGNRQSHRLMTAIRPFPIDLPRRATANAPMTYDLRHRPARPFLLDRCAGWLPFRRVRASMSRCTAPASTPTPSPPRSPCSAARARYRVVKNAPRRRSDRQHRPSPGNLAEAFPDKGLLPANPKDRAEALSLIAEMHSGFAGPARRPAR